MKPDPHIPFAQAVASANDAIMITDSDTSAPEGPAIIYVNRAFETMTGYSADELIGQSTRFLHGPDTDIKALNRIHRALVKGRATQEELINYNHRGHPFWVDIHIAPIADQQNQQTYFVAIIRDISNRKRIEQELYQLATTDSLTGALNHRHYLSLTERELALAVRSGAPLSLVILDIDFFKQVNDQYGHQVGDIALIQLVNILQPQLRETDLFGRIGGEEFAVTLPNCPIERACMVTERLQREIHKLKIEAHSHVFGITASFGIAQYNAQEDDLEQLLARADSALYEAKNSGRNCIRCA